MATRALSTLLTEELSGPRATKNNREREEKCAHYHVEWEKCSLREEERKRLTIGTERARPCGTTDSTNARRSSKSNCIRYKLTLSVIYVRRIYFYRIFREIYIHTLDVKWNERVNNCMECLQSYRSWLSFGAVIY